MHARAPMQGTGGIGWLVGEEISGIVGATYDRVVASTDATELRYAGWLPGPWIDLTEYGEAEPDEFRARCEVCGDELRISFDAEDEYERVADVARRDWESHVADQSQSEVRYFLLPGVGPHKSPRVGRWDEVVRAVPYLLFAGDPVPPIAVLNGVLTGTDGFAGMSGGVEWPRHELTTIEYNHVRERLVDDLGLIDVDAPDWVESREAFRTWTIVARSRCSRAAAEAWLRAVVAAGGGDALTRLHEQKEAWLRAFDAGEL